MQARARFCSCPGVFGKAMREIGFRPVIATKVEIMPDELDHIADAVVESVEDSLKRLQLDHVDIVQIHNPPSIER